MTYNLHYIFYVQYLNILLVVLQYIAFRLLNTQKEKVIILLNLIETIGIAIAFLISKKLLFAIPTILTTIFVLSILDLFYHFCKLIRANFVEGDKK